MELTQVAPELPSEFLHRPLQSVAWHIVRSTVVSVVWFLIDFQFVLAPDAVIKAGLILVSNALVQARSSSISSSSRQAQFHPFSGSFALVSGVVASVQHYVNRQAFHHGNSSSITSFAFALGAVALVRLVVVRHAQSSLRFNRYQLGPRVGRSCVRAAFLVRRASSLWGVIKVFSRHRGHH